MTRFKAVRLVAGRELSEAFRRKSYWAVFLLLLAGATAVVVLPEVIGGSGTTRYDVAVVGPDPVLGQSLRSLGPTLDAEIRVRTVADETTARRQVESGDVDVAVVPGAVTGGSPAVILQKGKDAGLVGAVGQALATTTLEENMQEAGLSNAQVESILAVPAPRAIEVNVEKSDRRAASFVLSLVLYLLLLTLMMQVATGIAIEKANRISEVLLAIVRPGALLFGKVIGVGISGLLVLSAGIVPVLVKFVAGGDLPAGIGGALAAGAAWFGLGLALYLTVAGALGALVERQEEVGSVVTPLTAVLVGTFLVAQGGPDSALASVLAYIPLTSPLIEPTRIALGVTSPIEIVGSLALLVVSIAFVGRAGSAVYARAVVRNDHRLKLRDVIGRSTRRPSTSILES